MSDFRNPGLNSSSQDFNPNGKRPAMPQFYNSKKDPQAAERLQEEMRADQEATDVSQSKPHPATPNRGQPSAQ